MVFVDWVIITSVSGLIVGIILAVLYDSYKGGWATSDCKFSREAFVFIMVFLIISVCFLPLYLIEGLLPIYLLFPLELTLIFILIYYGIGDVSGERKRRKNLDKMIEERFALAKWRLTKRRSMK